MEWSCGIVRAAVDPRVEEVHVVLAVAGHNLGSVEVKVDGGYLEFLVPNGGWTVLERKTGGMEELGW